MKVLVVGSGGREHALCWALASSALCDALYCTPGNAGIAAEATCVAIGAEDLDGLLAFCREEGIDFVVVGPEGPLVLGLVDRLSEAGIKAFGPSAAAAVLEGSKGFTKDLCAKYGIPTAAYGRFSDAESARYRAEVLINHLVRCVLMCSVSGTFICSVLGIGLDESAGGALTKERDLE